MTLGCSFSPRGPLPRLRRLKIYIAAHPALPGWATMFRASGAESRLTNRGPHTTSRRPWVPICNPHTQIHREKCTASGRERQSPSAGGAAERSPARKGWERCKHNSEHRRCHTFLPRTTVRTQTAQPGQKNHSVQSDLQVAEKPRDPSFRRVKRRGSPLSPVQNSCGILRFARNDGVRGFLPASS
jgi:hypothetical protein